MKFGIAFKIGALATGLVILTAGTIGLLMFNEAERILTESGVKGKKRKGAVDRLAAQILLSSYLRHLESGGA